MGQLVLLDHDANTDIYSTTTPTLSWSSDTLGSAPWINVVSNGGSTWVALTNGSVATSTDGGVSYSETALPGTMDTAVDVVWDFVREEFVIVGIDNTYTVVYYSTDGSSWTAGATSLPFYAGVSFGESWGLGQALITGAGELVIGAWSSGSVYNHWCYASDTHDPGPPGIGQTIHDGLSSPGGNLNFKLPTLAYTRRLQGLIGQGNGLFVIGSAQQSIDDNGPIWCTEGPSSGHLCTLASGDDGAFHAARYSHNGDYWIGAGVSSGDFWWGYSDDGKAWVGTTEPSLGDWYVTDGFYDGEFFWFAAVPQLSPWAGGAIFQYDPGGDPTAGTWTRHDLSGSENVNLWVMDGQPIPINIGLQRLVAYAPEQGPPAFPGVAHASAHAPAASVPFSGSPGHITARAPDASFVPPPPFPRAASRAGTGQLPQR